MQWNGSDMIQLRTVEEVHRERMDQDPTLRMLWERTAFARAVANRIIGYRIQHGLTQTALATRLGMRQSAISRLELGEHNPSVETLLRLSGMLGMEFLLHVAPKTGTVRWPEPVADDVTVVEAVESASHASTALAAAR